MCKTVILKLLILLTLSNCSTKLHTRSLPIFRRKICKNVTIGLGLLVKEYALGL